MHPDIAPTWPPAGVSVAFSHSAAGSGGLAPIDRHRIIIHASPATRSICRVTGRDFLRRAGDIDLVPAHEPGGFDAISAYRALEIRLAPGVLERVATELGRPGAAARFEMRHMLRDERIYHLARALESDRRANSPSGTLYGDSVGVALAARLLALTDDVPPSISGLSSAQLKRVLDHIDAHLERSLTIETLSREAGASSSHLRASFKIATGLTLHRYVLRRRVERARNLLLHDRMPISQVALAAGFSHQSHLARWMRRELGVTPSDLRRQAGAHIPSVE